jgi:hypothetical protein
MSGSWIRQQARIVRSSICSTLVHLFLEKHKMSAMIRLVLPSIKKDVPGRRAPPA